MLTTDQIDRKTDNTFMNGLMVAICEYRKIDDRDLSLFWLSNEIPFVVHYLSRRFAEIYLFAQADRTWEVDSLQIRSGNGSLLAGK